MIGRLPYHVWQIGDTLPEITKRYYGNQHLWEILARMNGIEHHEDIKPDREIVLYPLGY